MISFVVPALNEQACLGRTLQEIHKTARALGQPYEAIVVDDASTDATAELARQNHARVVSVNHRQIAATRNAGGRAASGERLFFVDADTTVNTRAVASALRCMEEGAAGGGAPTLFDGVVPLYTRLLAPFCIVGAKLAGFTGGAFMFCTREAFARTGGFDERLYWAEEGAFALALKRQGRFVVLWKPVLTSGRRFRTIFRHFSLLQLPVFVLRMVFSPAKMLTQRASVEKIWYDSNREDDESMPDSLSARVFNVVLFVFTMVLLTGPLWYLVPRSLTPLSSPLGKFRFGAGIVLCHAGLILWPLSFVLLLHLFRRRQWLEWIKLSALFAFCLWQAWGSTEGAIRIWTQIGHWLAEFYNG